MKTILLLMATVALCLGDGYFTEFPWEQDYVTPLATGMGAGGDIATCSASTSDTNAYVLKYSGAYGNYLPDTIVETIFGWPTQTTTFCFNWNCLIGDSISNATNTFSLVTSNYSPAFRTNLAWMLSWPSSTGVLYGITWHCTATNLAQLTTNYFMATTNPARIFLPFAQSNYIIDPDITVWRTNSITAPWCTDIHGSGFNDECTANGIARGSDGSLVSVGQWRGTILLDGWRTNYSGAGANTYDGWIAKFSESGAVLWATNFGNHNTDTANAVAVDNSGNVFVTGTFTIHPGISNINFGCGLVSGLGSSDAFVAKYSSSGGCVWANGFGGTGSDFGYAIAVDGASNIVVGGYTASSSVNFGCGALPYALTNDLFCAKLDNNGACLWSKRFGGASVDTVKCITTDTNNDVLVVGYINGTANFGGGAVVSTGAYSGFLVKYAGSNGDYIWSRTFGSVNSATAWGVAVDRANNDVIVTGTAGNGTGFGGAGIVNYGGSSVFVVRYNSSGSYLWHTNYGGDPNCFDYGNAVGVDGSGRVTVTGRITSAVTFDGVNWYWGNGLMNSFTLNLTSAGAHRWSTRSETSTSQGKGIVVDTDGNSVACGEFRNTVTLGGIVVNTGGASLGAYMVRQNAR